MPKESECIFQAVAHPARRDLLDALRAAQQPLSITELAKQCEISRPTASRHLAVLRACGFIIDTRVRTSRMHEIEDGPFLKFEDWLWGFLR